MCYSVDFYMVFHMFLTSLSFIIYKIRDLYLLWGFYTELVLIVCFPLLMLVLCKVENSQEAQANTLGDLVYFFGGCHSF